MSARTRTVGVDFGTTTSLVAEGVAGRAPVAMPIGRTTTYIPSLFGLDEGDHVVVGDAATSLPHGRVKRSVKRCITRNDERVALGDGTVVSADEGIRSILAEVARQARTGGLDLSPETTRLGCPAMWTGTQRQRLLDLAERAGLPVSDHTLIDEPVAAGVAWVQQQRALSREVKGRLLVVDMGGGTLDVALLDIHAELGHEPEISVLSSWGIDEAGDALDEAVASDLSAELAMLGHDPGSVAPGVLQLAARDAKLQLTERLDTTVAVRDPRQDLPALHYTRERLDTAFQPQLHDAERLIWAVLRGAEVTYSYESGQKSPSDIRAMPTSELAANVDYVLLAGGMARVPALAARVESLVPHAELHRHRASDEAIVTGLAETIAYEGVNLHRPPFSFVLEHVLDGVLHTTPVYEAYEPFYDPAFAMQRHVLYYEWQPQRDSLPRSGHGWLRVRTAAGRTVNLRFDEDEASGAVRVQFGHVAPRVTIRPDGLVHITDGRRSTHAFRIPRWPVLRGADHAVIEIRRVTMARRPEIRKPWDSDPLFLH